MEELINQIVELDNHAKEKIRSIKDKEDNIETYISETLEKEKKKLDSRFVFMKKNAEERFNNKFAQEKERLDKSKTEELEKLRQKYSKQKDTILRNLVDSII